MESSSAQDPLHGPPMAEGFKQGYERLEGSRKDHRINIILWRTFWKRRKKVFCIPV